MASKKKITAESKPNNVSEMLSKSEQFIEKNQKNLLIGIGVVVVIVVAILGYRTYYLVPKEKEAEAAIVKGENYFADEKWDLALDGDDADYLGFESIINDYKFTKTAKLAHVYAGICYYYKGDFEQAKKYLGKYSAEDRMISPSATGLIGDCYVEMNELEKGVGYFEKAAAKADNDLISPIYLKKAGRVYEQLQKFDKAIKTYQSIKQKYPTSQDANDVDKFIERAKMKL